MHNNPLQQSSSSSSTLHNYISSGQPHPQSSHHHDTSSSCVDCENIHNKINRHDGKSEQESDSGSSSGDDGELVQPLHRHIIEHSRQIEATINSLQVEIEKLKMANSSKDVLIEDLRRELKLVQISKINQSEMRKDVQQAEFIRRQKEVQKIRQEMYKNSLNFMNVNKIPTMSHSNPIREDIGENSLNQDINKRIKHVQVMYEDKVGNSRQENSQKIIQNKNKKISYSKKVEVTVRSDQQSSSSDEEGGNEHHQTQQRGLYQPKKQPKQPTNQTHRTQVPSQTKHRSSKQLPPSNNQIVANQANPQYNQLQYELKEQMQKITRLERHIQFCQDEMLWMTNFIIAFLKMGQKLMAGFQQPVIKEHWSMRKKTKIAWRYVKHLFSYLMG